jgi:flagellar biosynthesis/type III secretory pathway chaperone
LEENINVKARVARVICDFDNQEISRLNELVEFMKEEIVELQSYNAAIKDEARHINNVSINSEMIISEKDSIIQKLKYLLKVNNISEDTISAIESISSTTPVVSTPAISTQYDTSNSGNSTIQQLKEDNQK